MTILSLFFFSSFFYVKAIRQSLIQHSSISVVAYIRKRGTALGWDLKYLCCGRLHTLKLGAVHLHDNRGSSFRVIQWKRGAPGKCSVFSKGQIYCSLPCTAWPWLRHRRQPGRVQHGRGLPYKLVRSCHCKLLLRPLLLRESLPQLAGRNDTLHSHPVRRR